MFQVVSPGPPLSVVDSEEVKGTHDPPSDDPSQDRHQPAMELRTAQYGQDDPGNADGVKDNPMFDVHDSDKEEVFQYEEEPDAIPDKGIGETDREHQDQITSNPNFSVTMGAGLHQQKVTPATWLTAVMNVPRAGGRKSN